MTKQKGFKRRVRARMVKTGESYTAARRTLIAQGDRPDTVKVKFERGSRRRRSARRPDGTGWVGSPCSTAATPRCDPTARSLGG